MASATQRLETKQQTLEDAYSPPANFLEIDVCNPQSRASAGGIGTSTGCVVNWIAKAKSLFPNFLVRRGKDKFPSALMTDSLTVVSLRQGGKGWKSSSTRLRVIHWYKVKSAFTCFFKAT
ncbi:Sorting nexin-3 [Taenia crassiceps]|uniref:Sorting nexin-3 n=1 Tax=Taenia crassiceps TaxID=6207 RepID=A0ABR4PZP9_9CEST